MRIKAVALWAALGMVGTTAVALAVPLASTTPTKPVIQSDITGDSTTGNDSRIVKNGTLSMEARLGHAKVSAGSTADTLLFTSVTSVEPPSNFAAVPLNLAIVIDRSGSMKGERIANAIAAAVGTIDRMREGDTVTVVTFDTQSQTIVSPTRITSSSRAFVQSQIRAIRLGGDTCISCGLETAMNQIMNASTVGTASSEAVSRILLLSDGATNHGIRDLPGLRALAATMRNRGCAISTIGVDVEFDEKVMAALAAESNGRHYFVANAGDLPSVFAQEFDTLLATVARDSEVTIDLAPGVVVEQVFDRTFRREGSRIIVPFGTFSARQEKTVLMRLKVPADADGKHPVASIKLAYRDLVTRTDGAANGEIALDVVSDGSAQKDLDPFVAARLERSRTAQTLTEANQLFEQGRVDEAKRKLETQKEALDVTARRSHALAKADPFDAPEKSAALDRDFKGQSQAVAEAEANFAAAAKPAPVTVAPGNAAGTTAPPAPARIGQQQIKRNAEITLQQRL
jgi:Ca-activated chloride channel family protein